VLIVCSYRSYLTDGIAPFIKEQAEALNREGIETFFFLIQGKGITGYLNNLKRLKNTITEYGPEIIHAHYGLSGVLANLQRRVPVITTFHGSDINDKRFKIISCMAIHLSRYNIYVSEKMAKIARAKRNYSILPCDVNSIVFQPMDKLYCHEKLKLDVSKKYILFSKEYSVVVKNYPLAKSAVEMISEAELLELKGYSREEVCLLMNACDVALMTSFSEGSPQFIKEAMLCNLPIVSTDVGDVSDIMGSTEGCYISSYNVNNVATNIRLALDFGRKTNGRDKCLLQYDNKIIAKQLNIIYVSVLYKNKKRE